MKRFLSLSVVALLMISLTACAAPSTDTPDASSQTPSATDTTENAEVRVVWWGSDSRHEITLSSIDLFEAANPNITIVPEYMGSDSYWDKLATQVSGGNAPDVIQFGGNYPDYVAKDALLPLNDYFGNIIDTTNIDKGVIDSATMDGKTYGLCLGTNMLGIAYNKTMLDKTGVEMFEPGASWEALGSYCAEVAPLLPEGTFPMTDNSGNNTNYIGFYSRQMGTPMYTTSGNTEITVDTIKDFLDIWAGWRAQGIIPDAETSAEYSEEGPDHSSLVAGKVALTMLYSNQLVSYQSAMEDELGILPLPDMEKNAAWVMPSQYFCINKASAAPDAAATFINYFVNTPEVGKVLGNDRGISASSKVREAIAATATPIDQQVYDLYAVSAAHTTPMDPNVPNDQEFTDGFTRTCQEVSFGQKDTATAAQETYDFLLAMIAKK
ncbi:MAG: ABC transporter substrate-binding protein [Acetanaerobacterium sp.]